MKTLPKVYKSERNYFKDNNKKICYVKNEEVEIVDNKDHNIEVIESIFNTIGYPFDKKVLIKTKDRLIKTYLVSRTTNTITTLNDEEINIDDILLIERI